MTTRGIRCPMACAFVALFVLTRAWTNADTLILKNGNRLDGQIVKQTDRAVTIQLPFGTITLPREQIASIEAEGARVYHLRQGDRQRSLGNYAEAIREYGRALKNGAGREAHVGLAMTYAARGWGLLKKADVVGARKALHKALEHDPGNERAKRALAQITQAEKEANRLSGRAESLMDAGKRAECIAALRQALKTAPWLRPTIGRDLAAIHVEEADRLFGEKRFREAEREYDAALLSSPSVPSAAEDAWAYCKLAPLHQALAQARIPPENLGQVEKGLRSLLRLAPGNRAMHYYVGAVAERRGDLKAAYAAYAQGLGRTPALYAGDRRQYLALRADLEKSLTSTKAPLDTLKLPALLPPEAGDWDVLSRPPFVIHHQSNPHLAEQVAKLAALALPNVARDLGGLSARVEFDHEVHFYVYASKEEYQKRTKQPEWSKGFTRVKSDGGKLLSHEIRIFYTRMKDLRRQVIPHELAHVILPNLLGYPDTRPLWIEEGCAVRQESYSRKNGLVRILLDRARRGNLISLSSLFKAKGYPSDKDDVELFYAISFTLVSRLMEEGGPERFLRFAKLVCDGGDPLAALQELYRYRSERELLLDWLKFVRMMK